MIRNQRPPRQLGYDGIFENIAAEVRPKPQPSSRSPYSKFLGGPYTRRFGEIDGQIRNSLQVPAESFPVKLGGGFGGFFDDPVLSVKTFVSTHPFWSVVIGAVAVGFATGSFKGFLERKNPKDEYLF